MQYTLLYCSRSLYAPPLRRLTPPYRHPLRARRGSIRQLAKRFQVSPDSVRCRIKQYRASGSISPKPYAGGPQPTLQATHHEVLRELIETDNDATLAQLAERLATRTGTHVSSSTISRTLSKLGITRKKSLKASEVYRHLKQQQRYEYWQDIRAVDADDLVFLDETGMNLAMVCRYARAQR